MILSQEWFSAAEIATLGLCGMPATKRGVAELIAREGWRDRAACCRERAASGGGVEYHYSLLPLPAQADLAIQLAKIEQASERASAKAKLTREEMWARFEALPQKKRAKAQAKLEAIEAVAALVAHGTDRIVAIDMIARRIGVGKSTLYGWEACIAGVARHDWLPYLAPRQAGSTDQVECSSEAWDCLRSDFLRPERPSFEGCWRRLEGAARQHGWTLPSKRTLLRRVNALPEGVRVLARDGAEALKRMYPAQERHRDMFHALEAVNADGHKWDVFVRWPDGQVCRPMMVAFQDLYSGKLLSWRVDKSENREAVRLALGDLVEAYGIPDHCWLDNGRGFASKWITGGTPTRYRFKVRDDEPAGILTQLGVTVHWTTPYHGQAKPIERAFRDFAGDTAKHPKFAGAYTGNDPLAKPENYGNAAVPLETFLAVVAEAVREHNARAGRRSKVCNGRSFDDVFAESYAAAPIRKSTEQQRRLWLLAAEGLLVGKRDGVIELLGNRFWSDFLHEWRGHRVVARFDPQQLQQPLHVYRLDGAYLGAAAYLPGAGFADADAAQEFNRNRNRWARAEREKLAAERRMTPQQVAALLPDPAEPAPLPASKVVRLMRGSTALQPIPIADDDNDTLFDAIAQMNRARQRAGHLHVVNPDDGDRTSPPKQGTQDNE